MILTASVVSMKEAYIFHVNKTRAKRGGYLRTDPNCSYRQILRGETRLQDFGYTEQYSVIDNVSTMLAPIDDDEKVKFKGCTNNAYPPDYCTGMQTNTEYLFLTEDRLYEVLILFRKPVAKEFTKGTKKLLHDLRMARHGSQGYFVASCSVFLTLASMNRLTSR